MSKMEELHLSEALQRYFSDVFLCCDEDKSGLASLNKTIDLIKSANVPDEIINQISELCWPPGTVQLTRRQFYAALKLVAVYQANLNIKSDLITANLELPLPRFSWNNSETDLIELGVDKLDTISTDSEVDSDTLSIVRNESPEISSTASDSPTPTNSVQDRSWAVGGAWHGLVSEEQRQLLGTEEESSDRHSSEEDTEVSSEIWTINPEQREYYTNQFRSLQPDLNALLAGPVARMFFEKSRLPVHELRKIWQLADITKDGALSLQEFNTAMHLVVLRRNHIELPEQLPVTLLPNNNDATPPISISPETEPILSPPQTKDTAKEWTKFIDSPTSSISSPGPKPCNFDFQKVTLDKDSTILHPVPLRVTPECSLQHAIPTNNTNNITTTGTGASLVQDDTIDGADIQSSPKKFTVDHNILNNNSNSNNNNINSAIQRPQPKKINLPGPGAIPPPPPSAVTTVTTTTTNSQNNSQSCVEEGPVSLPAFPPPKKEKPPPPPPRPFKTHGRSSSLDLNRLNRLGAPPTVPPRVSPNIHPSKKLINQRSEGDCGVNSGVPIDSETPFANFDNFEQYENVPSQDGATVDNNGSLFTGNFPRDLPRLRHGAFEVYRKPIHKQEVCNIEDKTKWELYQKLQEENAVLLRICQELSQELADVREEKLTLKIRLEKQLEQINMG